MKNFLNFKQEIKKKIFFYFKIIKFICLLELIIFYLLALLIT